MRKTWRSCSAKSPRCAAGTLSQAGSLESRKIGREDLFPPCFLRLGSEGLGVGHGRGAVGSTCPTPPSVACLTFLRRRRRLPLRLFFLLPVPTFSATWVSFLRFSGWDAWPLPYHANWPTRSSAGVSRYSLGSEGINHGLVLIQQLFLRRGGSRCRGGLTVLGDRAFRDFSRRNCPGVFIRASRAALGASLRLRIRRSRSKTREIRRKGRSHRC